MIVAADDQVTSPRIILAAVPDFQIGGLQVRPARRQVCPVDGNCRELEPRIMQVLVALAQAGGEIVSRDELIEACWDGRIVGDDSINRCMVALRRLARSIDPPPFEIETVARVGYCLAEPGTDRSALPRGGTHAARRRPIVAGIVTLAVAAVIALGVLLWPRAQGGADDRPQLRLATIRALSHDLPDGIADSLREELIAAFEVDDAAIVITADSGFGVGRTTRFLRGTIQRAGDRLRFAVHLRDERSGASLWAQIFELPASFSAVAPRQVAARVSQVLRCGLPGAGPYLARMTDRQLSLWLQFCQEIWSNAPTTRNRTIDVARRVTEAAPDFSRGWSSLALYAQPMGQIGPEGDVAALRLEAAQAVARALRLDPQNSEAYAAWAAAFVERHDWIAVERLLQRALSVRPTDCTCEHHQYGFLLTVVGRLDEAVEAYRRFRDRQPLTLASNLSLAEALFRAEQYEEGERILAQARRIWPEESAVSYLLLLRAFWAARYEEGAALLAEPRLSLPSQTRAALAATFAALRSGQPEARLRAAEMLKAMARDPGTNTRLVTTALAAIGEDRAAIQSVEANGFWMRGALFEASFARARRDPAFAPLVQRLGLIRYWRQTGRMPDACREANAPPFCRAL
ncbi:MAG: hypothetical protein QOI38_891 [Sphingomonadales bacterium]|jgi:DNA-binding winged helix-turn-helix (wHTH) protein/tetratricopeptide (TPR) repeat protein|nr:hypothetical protein [Sphingomonadales bacterium]